MKKERNLLITNIIFAMIYAILTLILPWFRDNWFSMVLYFVSMFMFIKSYFFRSDSSLFFAVLFFQISFLFMNKTNKFFTLFQLGSVINTMVALAFLVDFLVFNSKFTFYSFLTNFSVSLPILFYSFNCINLILMILFVCGALLLSIAIIFKKDEKIQSS